MPDVNHKDALGRLLTVMSQNANKEHFLRPRDGRLQTLKTQNLQGKWVELAKSSWGRVLPVNRTPILIEILHWVYPYGFDRRNDRNIAENLVLFSLRYIAACFAILICVCEQVLSSTAVRTSDLSSFSSRRQSIPRRRTAVAMML